MQKHDELADTISGAGHNVTHDLTHAELAWLVTQASKWSSHRWQWIRTTGGTIRKPEVRIERGEIVSATSDPPRPTQEIVRAVYDATARRAAKRAEAANKAATTRQHRQATLTYKLAATWLATAKLPPSLRCNLCKKPLTDPDAIERGIGSECWQNILNAAQEIRSRQQQQQQQHEPRA